MPKQRHRHRAARTPVEQRPSSQDSCCPRSDTEARFPQRQRKLFPPEVAIVAAEHWNCKVLQVQVFI